MKKFWDYISSMGYSPDLSHEEARRIKLLSRLNSIIFMVLCLYVLVNLILRIYVFIPHLLVAMFFLATNLMLLYKKAYAAAKHFSMFNITLAISFFSLFTGDVFTVAYFIPLAAMPLVIFKCRKTAGSYLAALLILGVIIRLMQSHVTPLIPQIEKLSMMFSIISIVCSAMITWFLVFYYKAANEEYENTLIKMHEVVTEKNREITDSIIYAKRIQDALITSEKYIEKSLDKLINTKDADKQNNT
jgi:hypothetical protein